MRDGLSMSVCDGTWLTWQHGDMQGSSQWGGAAEFLGRRTEGVEAVVDWLRAQAPALLTSRAAADHLLATALRLRCRHLTCFRNPSSPHECYSVAPAPMLSPRSVRLCLLPATESLVPSPNPCNALQCGGCWLATLISN